jgi:hypothetical protein
MVLLSVKKLEKEIKNRTITQKQFIIYSLFVVGPFLALFRTSRYPVNIENIEAYNIAFILSFVPFFINIIKYLICYKIIKNKNIVLFLYSIIPINFVLNLKYTIFLIFPMTVISISLIKHFNIEFIYWNVLNSTIITIIFHLIITINTIVIINNLYQSEKEDNITDYGIMWSR